MSKQNDTTNWKKGSRGKEIRIYRVSSMLHQHIQNVADHLGVSVTDFCKVKMLDNISTFPRHYLEPFNKEK